MSIFIPQKAKELEASIASILAQYFTIVDPPTMKVLNAVKNFKRTRYYRLLPTDLNSVIIEEESKAFYEEIESIYKPTNYCTVYNLSVSLHVSSLGGPHAQLYISYLVCPKRDNVTANPSLRTKIGPKKPKIQDYL